MAFIDFVRWTPNGENIYAWKFPHTNLSTFTQLVVQESQEAILFSKGQIVGKFGQASTPLTLRTYRYCATSTAFHLVVTTHLPPRYGL